MWSDEALYERLRGGDLSAFDELWARYERPLFGFVLRHVQSREEAEDLLHEAFMSVLKAKRAEGPFRAWLFQVARNLCLNRLRGRGRGERALEVVARDEPETVPPPEESMLRHQAVAALHAALDALPARLTELYHLRAAGLSYDEMAQVVDAPVGTIKSRMHELIARLREEMKPWTAG